MHLEVADSTGCNFPTHRIENREPTVHLLLTSQWRPRQFYRNRNPSRRPTTASPETKMTVIDTSKSLSALFHAQALRTPDAEALVDQHVALTYAELDGLVDALARRLRAQHQVGRDDLVGVLIGRSADYVIACLAALRAGGAFLVLELAYPSGLLADVLENAAPKVILTHEAHVGQIKGPVPVIEMDREDWKTPIEGGRAAGRGRA